MHGFLITLYIDTCSFVDMKGVIMWSFIQDEILGMEYGVMSMPAIVVKDKVVAFGKVLKTAEVEKLLKG